MKRPPFDDPGAWRRRWSHLTPEQLRAESVRDPLLFAADHLSLEDRHEGTVVVVAEVAEMSAPISVVIPGGPPAPAAEECLGMLARVVAHLDSTLAEMDEDDPYDEFEDGIADQHGTEVTRLGIVIHRLGSSVVHEIDRRWTCALGLLCVTLDIETIGVLARTRSGALVRAPAFAAA